MSPTSFEEFPNSLGIVGLVSKSKKPVFTANLKNSPQFDSKVDLMTLMSVLTYPLVENIIENNNGIKEKVCLGILQIPIKESGKLKVSEEIGEMREDAEAMAEFFGRIVELAYKYYKKTF